MEYFNYLITLLRGEFLNDVKLLRWNEMKQRVLIPFFYFLMGSKILKIINVSLAIKLSICFNCFRF